MVTTAKIARTDVPGAVPNVTDTSNTSYIEPGALFINVTDQILYSSNGTNYFQISGAGGGTANLSVTSQTFNGDGANTQFTLSTPANTTTTFVFLNGVAQVPTTDYSVSGSTLSFTTAPASIDVVHAHILDIGDQDNVEFTYDTFVGNGSNTQFTLGSSLTANSYALVFLNGVAQVPTNDYGVSGSTLTFTVAPTNTDTIHVISVNAIVDLVTTTFTGNGSNKVFTLTDPSSTNKTIVYINGVVQRPVGDYYVNGRSLIFITAPANNDNVTARTFYERLDAAGGNGHIQINENGILGSSPGLTFDTSTNNATVANTLTVSNFKIIASNPPMSNSSPGEVGTIAWDSGHIYVCVATNTWARAAITTVWP